MSGVGLSSTEKSGTDGEHPLAEHRGVRSAATVKTRNAPLPAAVKTSIGPAKSRISTPS